MEIFPGANSGELQNSTGFPDNFSLLDRGSKLLRGSEIVWAVLQTKHYFDVV
jgi:hypothetical protein